MSVYTQWKAKELGICDNTHTFAKVSRNEIIEFRNFPRVNVGHVKYLLYICKFTGKIGLISL